MGITIYLNGKKEEIGEGTSMIKLLEAKKIRPEVVSVELNDALLEREKYQETVLKERDRVEFVYYMGGGRPAVPKDFIHGV